MLHHAYRDNNAQRRSAGQPRDYMLVWLLCACLGHPVFAQSSATPDLQQFIIDTELSVLKIHVGRAGLLSGLGHEHLISNRAISGTLSMDTRTGQAAAHMSIPVLQMVVDDAAEREQAGYPAIADESARTGTRDNMRGADVLDSTRWPEVIIDARYSGEIGGNHQVAIILTFRGKPVPLQLPATVTITDGKLMVDSRFNLGHKQLGLQPVSAFGGVIRVAETLEFELHLEAIPAGDIIIQ